MKISNDLFDLIKSLSGSEKRYFKLSGVQGGTKNYLLLFDAIDEQKDYDETAIREKFMGEKFVEQLHVIRNQLYRLVLKSLRIYHEQKSIDNTLEILLREATLLKQRGLYEQNEKHLKKAKKIAKKHEKHLVLLKIYRWEVENILDLRGKKLGENINRVLDEADNSITLLGAEYACFRLQYNALTLFRTGIHATHPDYAVAVSRLQESPYFEVLPENKSSFNAKYARLHAKSVHFMLKNDSRSANALHLEIINVWEAHPHIVKARPRNYRVQLINYLQSCHALAKYDLFLVDLEKVKKLPTSSLFEEAESFLNVASLELLYFMNTKQFHEAKAILPDIRLGMRKYAKQISKYQEAILRYNIILLLFFTETYAACLDWINDLLNAPKTEVRNDLYRAILILQLVVHYELQNYRVLDYLLESVAKKLQREKQYRLFEKTMIRALHRLLSATSKQQRLDNFQRLIDQLDTIKKEKTRIFGLEEMLIWNRSRLENKSFMEILDGET